MLNKETRFLFEVTPKHPTRKVYDTVLFPDGFSYEKMMTVRQVVAAFNTCNEVKVVFDGAYYPVTRETIDAVMAEVEAGVAPTTVEAVEKGVRTLASYVCAIEPDVTLLGDWTTDKIADVKIEAGEVTGSMFWVEGFTEFNGDDVREQSGYYFPFAYVENEEYTDAKFRVINGRNPEKEIAVDSENLIWVGANQAEGDTKIVEISAKNVDGEKVVMTLRVNRVKFDEKPAAVSADTESELPDVDEGGIVDFSTGEIDENGIITL